ncbi:hypothetical protein EDB19DRAFT_1911926 [Suillus lakei]|nr:hypothetical protein EDB19DRAFT_1911926 [Suillus lakei]
MPSSLPVKDLIKRFFKDLNPSKGFAVRSKHPAKHGRTQRSSTATHDEGDDSIPADPMHPDSLARYPGLEVSTNASSARPSGGVSLAREASDMIQLTLPFVQALTGVIPIVGGPMKAAIGGLLAILQTIDIHNQNKADLDGLRTRLNRLSHYLCNAPPARGPLEEFRRDAFVRMLQGTLDQLTTLHTRRAAYPSITQAIAGCSSEIDRYLWECSVGFHSLEIAIIHSLPCLEEQQRVREELQRIREDQQRLPTTIQSLFIRSSVGSTSTRTVTPGFMTLVDATNRLHSIPMDVCDSFERFKSMLQLLFGRNTPQAQIQRRYMEKEQYELCIDDDQKITRLTSHEWPNIEVGTKIVMNVIIEKRTPRGVYYECPFCSDVNHVNVGPVMDSLERQAGCSIDCRKCKQRFQISRGYSSAKRGTRSADNDSDFNPTTDAGMHFIRNLHVQQTLVRDVVF